MRVQNKRWRAAFQFIKLLFLIRKVRVHNKQRAAFHFIKLPFVIQKRVFKTSGAAFVVRKMYVQNKQDDAF